MRQPRHARFYVALAVGIAVLPALVAAGIGGWSLRVLLAVNAFFLVYLLLTATFLGGATAADLRSKAQADDEGLALILLVTVIADAVSLGAILLLVSDVATAELRETVLAVAAVPLGWLTLHTLYAFHYARLFYARTGGDKEARGLDFPGTEAPGPWDFLYFSFVVGMTAQVSDVVVSSGGMRRSVLAHGALSFFYNTVIVALTVNAVVALAS
jgi:uncharacterized membrane protein